MKKYITVAALLAAGTAFANADVVAVFNCGHSSYTGWMDQEQGWTSVVQSTNGSTISGVTAGGITLSSTGSVLAGTEDAGSFTAGTGDDDGPYTIPKKLETLSSKVLGDGYDTLWGGSVNMCTAGSATLKLDGLTANTEYKVYLFSARANGETNGSVEWTTTATSNVDWSVWTVSGNGTWVAGTSSSTVQFDGSSDGLNASIVEVFFTTGADETSVSFSTGDNQRFTLNGIVVDQGSAIPEPSAFGLLAGLGALALVASRRRRK